VYPCYNKKEGKGKTQTQPRNGERTTWRDQHPSKARRVLSRNIPTQKPPYGKRQPTRATERRLFCMKLHTKNAPWEHRPPGAQPNEQEREKQQGQATEEGQTPRPNRPTRKTQPRNEQQAREEPQEETPRLPSLSFLFSSLLSPRSLFGEAD
jgi:hypothetical protein